MTRALALLSLFLIVACSSTSAPQIYRAPEWSAAGAETFRWASDGQSQPREKQAREVAAVVRQEVVSALQAKGLRQVQANADLVFSHELIVEMRSVVVGGRSPQPAPSTDAPFNDGRDVDMPESSVGGRDEERMDVPAGTLMITASDAQGRVVWRAWEGSAVDMLAIAQPELAASVQQVMRNFP